MKTFNFFIFPPLVKLKLAVNRHLAQHTIYLPIRGTWLPTVWAYFCVAVLFRAYLYFTVVLSVSTVPHNSRPILLHLSLGFLFVLSKYSAHYYNSVKSLFQSSLYGDFWFWGFGVLGSTIWSVLLEFKDINPVFILHRERLILFPTN